MAGLTLASGLTFAPGDARAQSADSALFSSARGVTDDGAALNVPMAAAGDKEVVHAERTPGQPRTLLTHAIEEPVDPDTYICGRGDTFELNFWGKQNFKLRVSVDLEGRMFISKVGYVEIQGKTLRQAREAVRTEVLRYFPGLSFDLSLVETRSFLVHVVDNVLRPGLYEARPVDRVSTVLERAGGVLERASRRRIQVTHRDGASTQVDLLQYYLTGATRHNPYLLDGDVVRVPFEELAVDLTGAVNRPGHYELVETKDLNELVLLAGGLSNQVTRQLPIKLVRRNVDELEMLSDVPFPADTTAAVLPALTLRTDDTVHVPSVEELQRTVMIVGALAGANPSSEQTTVRRMAFVEHDTVRSLLERAGGVSSLAALRGGSIVKRDGRTVPVDLEALLVHRDFAADRPLELGDTLLVPFKRVTVVVGGAVTNPSALLFNPKFTADNYLALAGGPTRFARELQDARLITAAGETIPYDDDMPVGPGDTIIVPERDFSRAEVVQLIISGAGLAVSAVAMVLAIAFR